MRIGDRIAIMQGGQVVQVGTPEEIVTNPANDYVRSFFYGVDVSQVFSAGDIAEKKQLTVIERPGVSVHAALDRLRQHGRNLAIVVGKDQKYHGMVTLDSLSAQLTGTGEGDYGAAFMEDVEPVPADMGLNEVLGRVASSHYPVPVVDKDGGYLGSISKTAILQTLDRTG
jgi:glycine betaine/proline transport system ATP-binding protein